MYLCKDQYGQHPEVVLYVVGAYMILHDHANEHRFFSYKHLWTSNQTLLCVWSPSKYPPSDFVHTHSNASASPGDIAGSRLPKVLSVNDIL